MKNYKVYMMIGFFAFGFNHFVSAQDYMKNNNRDKINNLSDEQRGELKEINKTFKAEMIKVKNDESLNDEAKKVKMKEIKTAKILKVEAVLTPEQLAEMKQKRMEKQAFKKENRKKGDFKKQSWVERMDAQLKLTDAQKEMITAIEADYQLKIREVRNNEAVEKEQKAIQVKELRKAQRKDITKVLTAEQKEALKQMNAEKKKDHKCESKCDKKGDFKKGMKKEQRPQMKIKEQTK